MIDGQLCELVARLGRAGYHHTLEVELRLPEIGEDMGKYDFRKFLPEFREKGALTVIDTVRGDLVLYSSPHGR